LHQQECLHLLQQEKLVRLLVEVVFLEEIHCSQDCEPQNQHVNLVLEFEVGPHPKQLNQEQEDRQLHAPLELPLLHVHAEHVCRLGQEGLLHGGLPLQKADENDGCGLAERQRVEPLGNKAVVIGVPPAAGDEYE